ncbi:MAG: hypothetical protein WCP15_03470 [bacterium]
MNVKNYLGKVLGAVQDISNLIRDELSRQKADDLQEEWLATSEGGKALKDAIIAGVVVFVGAWKASQTQVKKVAKCITRIIPGAESLGFDGTDGKENIAQSVDLFKAGIDRDFTNWGCDVPSDPTAPLNVTVHEMVENGNFMEIFGGINKNLNHLCLTQSQIIQFVQKHRKWLRTDGCATFFLFKVVFDKGTPQEREEFFVADVYFGDRGQLTVGVRRFSNDNVWYGGSRHRVVVPQIVS